MHLRLTILERFERGDLLTPDDLTELLHEQEEDSALTDDEDTNGRDI